MAQRSSGKIDSPPSSVVVNMQGRESGGWWFETCSGVWYPRRCPCGVAINTLVDLKNWLGKPQVFDGIGGAGELWQGGRDRRRCGARQDLGRRGPVAAS